MLEKGTIDPIFVIQQLQEKVLEKEGITLCICRPGEGTWGSHKNSGPVSIEEIGDGRSNDNVLYSKENSRVVWFKSVDLNHTKTAKKLNFMIIAFSFIDYFVNMWFIN